MTFDRQSTYVTFGGNIGTGSEDHWQTGFHLALDPSLDGPGLPSTGEAEDLLDGPVTAIFNGTGVNLGSYVSLNWIKFASLDDTGAYTTDPVEVGKFPVAHGGVGTSAGGPQLAAVITFYSGSSIGNANYGRMYLPAWEATLTDEGHVVASQVTTLKTAAVNFVNGVNSWAATALDTDARIRIMSKIGSGTTKAVTEVWVGDVKDTQQRRRRQLHEVYTKGTVTP